MHNAYKTMMATFLFVVPCMNGMELKPVIGSSIDKSVLEASDKRFKSLLGEIKGQAQSRDEFNGIVDTLVSKVREGNIILNEGMLHCVAIKRLGYIDETQDHKNICDWIVDLIKHAPCSEGLRTDHLRNTL